MLAAVVLGGPGCSDEPTTGENSSNTGELKVPKTYSFDSKLTTGSSVSYTGQAHRHMLIRELNAWVGGLTAQIDGGKAYTAGDVRKQLDFFYNYKAGEGAEVALTWTTTPPLMQQKFGQISDKNLKDKFAGNDAKGQHKDWNKELSGWFGYTSAEGLLVSWFDALDKAAVDRIAGTIGKDPSGKALTKVHVSAQGLDYQQLIQKFLLGAVTFSQGVDDYLDDDLADKGIRAQNSKADADGKPYTTLEHHWDEAFGYFGAARNFADFSDDEIAAKGGRDTHKGGYFDADGDGKIDVAAEVNQGHAVNCAKRDRGSKDIAATDFTKEAFVAFLQGRAIIHNAVGRELSADEMKALVAQRDVVVQTWEKAIAATVVHYFNEVLADHTKMGTDKYDFYDHAKHWSELKGFAMSLQFSRFSPAKLGFAALQSAIGPNPVLSTASPAQLTAYKAQLVKQRDALVAAYGFDAKLAGDEKGAGGW